MREYGTVKTAFWIDEKIAQLPRDAKYLALYLLTSPHTNAPGCFRAPLKYISADMDETIEWVRATMAVLVEREWAEYDEASGWIWIRNYLRHNPPANQNVLKKCWKEFDLVPETVPFWHGVLNSLQTVSKRFGNQPETPEPEPEPEPEPDPEPDPEKDSARDARSHAFDQFWETYPHPKNRGSKRKARERFMRVKDPPAVLRGAENYAAYCESAKDWYHPKMAEGWLGGERWTEFQELVLDDRKPNGNSKTSGEKPLPAYITALSRGAGG